MRSVTRTINRARGKVLTSRNFRRPVIYFLVFSLVFNALPSLALALEAGNMIDSSGIIGVPTWGDHTIIDTQNGAIINWNNFDTSQSQSVRFRQSDGLVPSAMSAVLNRVSSGAVPTQFNGALHANGRVFIVNPAGVIFGAGSTVNVSQLVASGLNMSDDAFGAVLADQSNKMVFAGGGGDVINNGTIDAGNSVYLVGDDVVNNGAIFCPGGLVVMAAGDTLQLGQPASNVIVDVSTDLIAGNDDSVTNNGTVGQAGSPVEKLILAAGDVFSQAIDNVGALAAIARDEVELGEITATGAVEAYSGRQANTSSTLRVNGNITAGSITLQAGDSEGRTNRNHYLTVADDATLHSTVGDVVISSTEHVTLGGDVVADNGGIFATADSDILGMGDLLTRSLEAPNGDIELKGRDVVIDGAVYAGGDITITGLEDIGWGGGIVHAGGTLTTDDGDIEIMVKDTWRKGSRGGETGDLWADGLIILDDDVTAGGTGEIRLHNDTELAEGKTLVSGADTGAGDTRDPIVDPETEAQIADLQRLWQLKAKTGYQIEDKPAGPPADQQYLFGSAPIPDEPELEISGCPALTKWAANELGTGAGTTQISIANSSASASGIAPCDACAALKRTATVLRDYAGTHIAALSSVLNEFASSDAPLSEEQDAAITAAIANGAETDREYALAKEYLDALAEYVGILNSGMDFSAADSTEFVMDKYIAPLAEDENVGLATFLAAKLANPSGS